MLKLLLTNNINNMQVKKKINKKSKLKLKLRLNKN